ncbi:MULTISPECIES: MFS transporter [unclassified Algoriphagus]|uniref:MFS transporter n=2 Tax=Algoriphagus TaxID=246875 RepID=UPI000C6BDD34|nr:MULTISPECIES: MFS transporter [unclassified Algoriphagus]MAL15119.1 MFS transporter [Algoriphagus sp.]MAN87884.1 MFS transporter [Algoriphagus sp.]HAS57283.1 MFS transporter [Algoriphagus sp.]HCH46129.1 MFS transporter [Algoriphagus sp.]|tara:strand:+ start:104 stop:1291 length:1188 start_codon:yes stop_codon:yes gene_type:complete
MKKEKLLLWTLAAINFIHIVDFMILMPLGPQLMRVFDISPREFGLLVSSYTFSAGISSFFGAFFLDRFDRKKILLWVYVGFSVATLGCALSPTYPILLSARIVSGLFGGLTSALILAIIGDVIPDARRGRAMGLVMAAFSVASVLGVPLGLFLASLSDWHTPFYILTGLSVISLGMIFQYVPNITEHLGKEIVRPHPLEVVRRVTSNPNQMRAITLSVMMMFGQFMIIPFLSPYTVANVGFTEMQLTYIYMAGGAFTIFTSPWVGKMSDKYGKLRIFTIFMTLNVVPIAIITNLGVTPIPYVLLVSTLFFVTSNGRYVPAAAIITGTARPENRGSFLSFNSAIQQLATGLASLIAGLIIGENAAGELTNFNLVGYIAIFFSLLCIPLARRVKVVS